MFWEEKPDRPARPADRVIELTFALEGRQIPVDHAWLLSQALIQALPWLQDEPLAAIHNIHVAGSQNGWERPTDTLYLSRRTKLQLRIPKTRIEDAQKLCGQSIELDNHSLRIGAAKTKPLNALSTLFARHLVSSPGQSEHDFLMDTARALQAMDIPVRKALCGKLVQQQMAEGTLECRSLLLAELDAKNSLLLQEQGLGQHRLLGCGIFMPHKDIDPIQTHRDDASST